MVLKSTEWQEASCAETDSRPEELQDKRRAVYRPTHDDAFDEMWEYSRGGELRRADFEGYAAYCMEQAAAGVPLVRYPGASYAALKFVVARWDDKHWPVMSALFAAYVRHGFIDPNQVMTSTRECPDHYRNLHGQRPLEAAVRNGNLQTALVLVLNGADTSAPIQGRELFDFVRQRFGEISPFAFAHDEASRQAVSARLAQAVMSRRIAAASTVSGAIASNITPTGVASTEHTWPARRRARVV